VGLEGLEGLEVDHILDSRARADPGEAATKRPSLSDAETRL
jgi:hypothetical protein